MWQQLGTTGGTKMLAVFVPHVATFRVEVAVRNLIDQMRGAGQIMGGPSNFTASNRQAFANQLDRWLARAK